MQHLWESSQKLQMICQASCSFWIYAFCKKLQKSPYTIMKASTNAAPQREEVRMRLARIWVKQQEAELGSRNYGDETPPVSGVHQILQFLSSFNNLKVLQNLSPLIQLKKKTGICFSILKFIINAGQGITASLPQQSSYLQ